MQIVKLLLCSLVVASGAVASDAANIINTHDGIKLSSKWSGPAYAPTAVLIIQGSGNVGTSGNHSSPFVGMPYRGGSADLSDQIAKALDAKGIASLRYAKRGVDDPAQLPNQTMPYIIADAVSAFETLKKAYPKAKLGIVGFSEGAIAALHVAQKVKADALFLMAMPTDTLDKVLTYQFTEWAVNVAAKLDANQDGIVSQEEGMAKYADEKLHYLGPTLEGLTLKQLDVNGDGKLSIEQEVKPAYAQTMAIINYLATTPAFAGWYQSNLALGPASSTLAKLKLPVYAYYGALDSQVDVAKASQAIRSYPKLKALRMYEGVGHCFSPFDGVLGNIKSSGPMQSNVLGDLAQDVLNALYR